MRAFGQLNVYAPVSTANNTTVTATQPLIGYNIVDAHGADVPEVPARRPPLALADAARGADPVLAERANGAGEAPESH